MKICSVGPDLSRAGRWTEGRTERQPDITKLIVTYR